MICEQFLKFNPLPLTTRSNSVTYYRNRSIINTYIVCNDTITSRKYSKGGVSPNSPYNREERGYTSPQSRTLERKKHPEAALYPQNLTRVCVLCVSVCVQWPEGRCFHDVPESALLNLYFEIRENCHGFS